ncbi:hypothetical protein WISP_122697 [Willisornis vidua]|uniref:Uncharacterized protein n=1 Tax=Willisornis vidua TaxID=1566151 RepID=A0ABQ9CXD1_9PASS|nr:hypothetical protein WISP_122697 [Willisornis vidua]
MIILLHEDQRGKVRYGNALPEPFPITNGVKQGKGQQYGGHADENATALGRARLQDGGSPPPEDSALW